MKYQNLAEMFFSKREEFPDKIAYSFKKDGQWENKTFKEAVSCAEKIAAGLASIGVGKGDRVAIISNNRIQWPLSDFASSALGAMLVPIYSSLLPEQVQYILDDSEAKVVIAENDIQTDKINEVRANLKTVKEFYVIESDEGKVPDGFKTFDALKESGEAFLKDKPDFVTESIKGIETDAWATLIYTSGTTGEPKGAILTHRNFLFNVEEASSVIDVYSEDTFLSFLPLSHVFERMAGHYLSCYHGATVAYAESVDTVAENMGEVKPTLMVSVPRLYEKIYGRVLESVEAGSPVKRKIFNWALGVGKEYVNKTMNKETIGGALQFKRNLAYKLVFGKLYERVGAKIRFFVSGGAPLNADIAEFFGAAGMTILEGYGLTETSPVISVNLLDHFKFGSVGSVLPNVEVKIAEDGEILTRGDHVMVGYYKKDAETKEAIDADGWFYTGDIGHIDEDGMLKITDRKKNLIVTSGGKNIAPQPIENGFVTSPLIDQALMIGDQRKFCSAVIVPSEEGCVTWAQGEGLTYSGYEELIMLEPLKEKISSEIERLSKNLARYETIKKFIFAKQQFTIESGELTPSLKVKRKEVEKNYASEINAMYTE